MKNQQGKIQPETDPIVAKTSVFLTPDKNLLFNAWERNEEARDFMRPFFREAAFNAMQENPEIKRVAMGHTVTGHSRKEWAGFAEIPDYSKHLKSPHATDTNAQYYVMDRTQMEALEVENAECWVSRTSPVMNNSSLAQGL